MCEGCPVFNLASWYLEIKDTPEELAWINDEIDRRHPWIYEAGIRSAYGRVLALLNYTRFLTGETKDV